MYEDAALDVSFGEGILSIEEYQPEDDDEFEIVDVEDEPVIQVSRKRSHESEHEISSPNRARRKTASSPASSPKKNSQQKKRLKPKRNEHFMFEEVVTIQIVTDDENEEVDIDC